MTFTTQPQNVTVVQGGVAVFHCSALEGQSALNIGWRFTPREENQVQVFNGTRLDGTASVTITADRSQLTLVGVQREVDGGLVVCSAIGSMNIFFSDSGAISVRRKYGETCLRRPPVDRCMHGTASHKTLLVAT